MEISAGIYCSSADLEILDDHVFFQQYNWAVDELFASQESQPQAEEKSRRPPLMKQQQQQQLRTNSPHYSFFNTTNHTSDESLRRVLAERKRREKLSHRFVALSSLLPHLKKMDKASILREAVKHITQLQRKVGTLESKVTTAKAKRWNGVVQSCSNQEQDRTTLPRIEAKMYNSEVLINIHHERRKGALEKVVGEIEKLHLSIGSCGFVPFGVSHLNITIIAKMEMEEEIDMSMEEVVNKLFAALQT